MPYLLCTQLPGTSAGPTRHEGAVWAAYVHNFDPTFPAADRYFCTYKRWIVYNASQVYHELQQAVPADVSLESRRHRGCCKGTDCLAPNVTIKKRSMKCASNNVPSRFHTQKEHSCHPVHTEQKNNQHFLRR